MVRNKKRFTLKDQNILVLAKRKKLIAHFYFVVRSNGELAVVGEVYRSYAEVKVHNYT